jgi:hypothetical protein
MSSICDKTIRGLFLAYVPENARKISFFRKEYDATRVVSRGNSSKIECSYNYDGVDIYFFSKINRPSDEKIIKIKIDDHQVVIDK